MESEIVGLGAFQHDGRGIVVKLIDESPQLLILQILQNLSGIKNSTWRERGRESEQ